MKTGWEEFKYVSFCIACKASSFSGDRYQHCGTCRCYRNFKLYHECYGESKESVKSRAKKKLENMYQRDDRRVWAIHGPLGIGEKMKMVELVEGTYEKACEYALTLPKFFNHVNEIGIVLPAKKTPVRKLE